MPRTIATVSAVAGLLALLAIGGVSAPARAQSLEFGLAFGAAPPLVDIDDRQGWRHRDDEDGERWGKRRLLPPRAIVGSLYRRGFSDVEIRRRRGDSYVVEAVSRRGSRVVAVIDGRTSEITGLRVIDRGHRRRSFDDGGWNDPRPWSGPRW
jgi:hypothetical protein